MAASYSKRISNEMELLEKNSDRYISPDRYYICSFTVEGGEWSEVEEAAKKYLSRNVKHQPLATYAFGDTFLLVFSCLDDNQSHYLEGSHHGIISEYISDIARETGKSTIGKIIEFTTTTQVITYLIWKVQINSKQSIISCSDGMITENDLRSKTEKEVIAKLSKNGVDWDEIDSVKKYGSLYKLCRRGGKVVFSQLSEKLDGRETRKYSKFVFG